MQKNKGLIHIVDDNSFIREFAEELISSLGYSTRSFSDAKEYLEYFSSGVFVSPLATFVDVIMPSMNGYDMIAFLQTKTLGMKFVIMSGEHDIQSDYKHLACMYLRKPFHPTCVEGVLEKLNTCASCGASNKHDCKTADHRGFYDLNDWACPSSFEVKLTQPST